MRGNFLNLSMIKDEMLELKMLRTSGEISGGGRRLRKDMIRRALRE